jgi:HSP20 family molecular chaperone IbpA
MLGGETVPEKHIPINVFRENERIMVSAPVPGMEPVNIHIVVEGRKITITSDNAGQVKIEPASISKSNGPQAPTTVGLRYRPGST